MQRSYIMLYATSKIDIRLTSHDLPKLLSLPVDFFERNLAGVISKHMQQDQRIREFLSGRLLLTVLDATALFVFIPVLMFYSLTSPRWSCSARSLIAVIIGVLAGHLPPSASPSSIAPRASARRCWSRPSTASTRSSRSGLSRPARDGTRRSALARSSGASRSAASPTSARRSRRESRRDDGRGDLCRRESRSSPARSRSARLVAFQILAGRVTNPLVQITALISEFQEVPLSVRMLGNVMNAPSEPGIVARPAPVRSAAR